VSPDVQLLIDRLKSRAAILMVGTIEPRKGYDAAIAAFEHLWQSIGGEAPDFVIVGKAGWKTRALQSRIRNHPEHNHRLHWLEGVSDEGLCMLYDSCIGLCMASRGEGFGLPLVEAVSHRLHVLARDLPVFREQALPNVLYFEDDDPVKLGGRLMELAALGAKGRPPIPNLPSWSASVDALLHELGIVRADGAPATSSLRRAV
jgi:glycosyltransferase involved in cell wall biosynthesis